MSDISSYFGPVLPAWQQQDMNPVDDHWVGVCRPPGELTSEPVAMQVGGSMVIVPKRDVPSVLQQAERQRLAWRLTNMLNSPIGAGWYGAASLFTDDQNRLDAALGTGRAVEGLLTAAAALRAPGGNPSRVPSGRNEMVPSVRDLPWPSLTEMQITQLKGATAQKWDTLRNQRDLIPNRSGVYIFSRTPGDLTNGKGVLYVGKADNLRSRLPAYLADPREMPLMSSRRPGEASSTLDHAGKAQLMTQIQQDLRAAGESHVWVRWIETADPEALESELISKLQPAFNTAGVDR